MSSTTFAAPRFSDPAVFGRVAVLMGGTSAEREVSLDAGRNVLEALRARDVEAFAVDGIPALVEAIRAGKVDRVFTTSTTARTHPAMRSSAFTGPRPP